MAGEPLVQAMYKPLLANQAPADEPAVGSYGAAPSAQVSATNEKGKAVAAARMSSLQRKRQAKKQARIAMKRIRAAEDLAGNESMPIGSGVAVVDWRTPPSAAVAVAEAAADRPRYFKDETGEVHAFTKDDAKHDASGWINVSLVTEDGDYESHPYDLFETGPHDMQLVGGVGLRMYFDYVHRTALIFFGVGVLSLISCHAMKEGGQLGHGMYLTLGNIYASKSEIESGTVEQLWVVGVVECVIILSLAALMFKLSAWKDHTVRESDDELITMSDYTVYIRPRAFGCRGWQPFDYGRSHWEWQDGSSRGGSWVLPSGESPAGFARALAIFLEEHPNIPAAEKVKIATCPVEDSTDVSRQGLPAKQMWVAMNDAENILLWDKEMQLMLKLEQAMRVAEETGDCESAENLLSQIEEVEDNLSKKNMFDAPPNYDSMRHIVGVFVTFNRQSMVKTVLELSQKGQLRTFNPHQILERKAAQAFRRGAAGDIELYKTALASLYVPFPRENVPKEVQPQEKENHIEAIQSYEPEAYLWQNLQFNWITSMYWKLTIYAVSILMVIGGVALIVKAEVLKECVAYVDHCPDVLGPDMRATFGRICTGAADNVAARSWYKQAFLQSEKVMQSRFPVIGAGADGCDCSVEQGFGCCNVYRYQTNISLAQRTPCVDQTGPAPQTWADAVAADQCHRVDYDGILKLYGDIDAMCYACSCHVLSTLQATAQLDALTTEAQAYLSSAINDEAYCADWTASYQSTQLFGYVGTVIIVAINQVMKQSLKYLTVFERHVRKHLFFSASIACIHVSGFMPLKGLSCWQDAMGLYQASLSLKIFVCTVLNTAVLFLLLRSTLFPNLPGDHYANVNAKWYAKLAAPLVLTMVTQFISASAINLLMMLQQPVQRLLFAKSKTTQNGLNSLYIPPDMSLAQMYSEVLLAIAVPAIYGSGVPLLYWVSGIGLMLKYCVDKYQVLRHYKRPPIFSGEMFKTLVGMNWLFVLTHGAFAVYFLSAAGGTDPVRAVATPTNVTLPVAHFSWYPLPFNIFLPHVLPVLAAFVGACIAAAVHMTRLSRDSSKQLRAKKQHGGFEKVKPADKIANEDDDYQMDVLEMNEQMIDLWKARVKQYRRVYMNDAIENNTTRINGLYDRIENLRSWEKAREQNVSQNARRVEDYALNQIKLEARYEDLSPEHAERV